MNPTSYVDLHQRVAADIDAEIEAALERIGPSSAVGDAMRTFLRHRKLKHPLSVLPLLVHAVETGTVRPAVPLSAVHVLWWTSACYLDDLADGHAAMTTGDLGANEALITSVISGHVLPIQMVRSLRAPEPIRGALTTEVLNCGIAAAEGQLDDIGADVTRATRKTVITAYEGKSSAPFGMITAMAATLARAKSEKVGLWREFGYVFGILWQLFNDQEDILSGRNEDLLNGTVTYLLACAIEAAPPGSRERILTLHAGSRHSVQAREQLAELLLTPEVLRQYGEDVKELRDRAYGILDTLGGDGEHGLMLRQLVDMSAQVLLEPGPVGRPGPVL